MIPKTTDYQIITTLSLEETPMWDEVLKIGNNIVNKYFCNWQLGFGTLLGGVREEDQYIHHDIDLDIDILLNDDEEDNIMLLEKNMLNNGFIYLRRREYEYKGRVLQMSMAYLHVEHQVIYDICFFRRFGEDYLHIGSDGIVIRPFYSIKRKKFKIKEVPCFIPERYREYLKGRYGYSWMTPKEKKEDWYEDATQGSLFIPLLFDSPIIRVYEI